MEDTQIPEEEQMYIILCSFDWYDAKEHFVFRNFDKITQKALDPSRSMSLLANVSIK